MQFSEQLRRNVRSLPLMTRLVAIPVIVVTGVPLASLAIWHLLMSPFWGVLLGVLVGAYLYVWTDLKLPGYRPLLVILIASEMIGRPLPFDDLSTIAVVLTYVAMFAIFEPGHFSRHRRTRQTSLARTVVNSTAG